MKKLIIILLSCFSINAFAADNPIYLSTKKDEEVISKLFETTRRINISSHAGMWKQDMLKMLTLSCAVKTKVINTEKRLILPNEVYSPVLRKEDILFLNRLNIKVGSYIDMDDKYCSIVADKKAEDLFKTCYLASVPTLGSAQPNNGYPRDYVMVGADFKDASAVDVGVYCNMIEGDPQSKQFVAMKGLATWKVKPTYTKVQFNGWTENLMLGSVEIKVDGLSVPSIFTAIYK